MILPDGPNRVKSRVNLILLTFLAFLLSPLRVFGFSALFHHQQEYSSFCKKWAETKTGVRSSIPSENYPKENRGSSSSRFKTSLWYSSGDKDETKFTDKVGTNKSKRKQKTNKYAKFSKADKVKLDPFESLVKESQQKLQAIEVENKLQRDRPLPQPPPKAVTKLEYPNNEGIDPYDPSSFGYRKVP